MKFVMLALIIICTFVPAAFASHFGYTVNGLPQGGISPDSGGMITDTIGYLYHAVSFSIDGMPAGLGVYFIFVALMAVAVIISFFGNVSVVGGIIFGILSIGGLISLITGLIKC
jgi:hypothetical protein